MKAFIFIPVWLLSFFCAIAQVPAFPGAEGFGKVATGGRGTAAAPPKIFEVTRLADDNAAGSFRYACTNNSPSAPTRIVVFRVAGTIHLNSALSLNRANTTIAGQTAPGGGICIADYPVTIGANNMIIRYMRFRLGDKNEAATLGNDDAFGDNGGGKLNLIIDHCTMSWSNDEALTVYKGDSVTLQWNFITEPLDYSHHDEGAGVQMHAYGGIESGKHTSVHHNLYAHIRGRMPRFDGIRNAPADTVDYRNNVLYNWADYTVNGGEGGAYNLVNNYYKSGLNSPAGTSSGVTKKAMVANPYKSVTIAYGKWYVTGNYVNGFPAVTDRNWLGVAMNGGTYADTVTAKSDIPLNISVPINTQTPQDAYAAVLAGAGASLPVRDTLDQRIVKNVTDGTGHLIDTQGGYPGAPSYTPYATTLSAWPALAAGFLQADTDLDGMPDLWETQRGLNPASNSDLNSYTSSTGYNNIETFLNGDTIAAPGILNSCVITRPIITTGSAAWFPARDTMYSDVNSTYYLAATDSNNIAAAVLDNGNYGVFNVSYYTTNTLRYDPVTAKPYLNRSITITPQNPLLITAPVTVRIYFSKKELDDLKAADPTIGGINDLNVLRMDGVNCGDNIAAGYTVISPTAAGAYGSYNNGYFLEFQTASFSTFYVGSKTNFLLPLRLLSFHAKLQGSTVACYWVTTGEINTSHFVAERSADAVSFQPAGTVNAFNTAGTHDYTFTDTDPLKGISFYRLQMVDADGRRFYSNVDRIINNAGSRIFISPDPVKDILKVQYPVAGARSQISIINSSGSMVLIAAAVAGSTNATLNISTLPAGAYTLLFTQNDGTVISNMFIRIQ